MGVVGANLSMYSLSATVTATTAEAGGGSIISGSRRVSGSGGVFWVTSTVTFGSGSAFILGSVSGSTFYLGSIFSFSIGSALA